ncbi:helix-turn-helix domain-containing protein [Pseudoxanthomonas sp. GW2]|uniref:helix-turn-helix domain-containing protein n=1 Tax=Pseudoxanthomonas sp. GW2 TaxID=1211114 RepID=UPI00037D02C3
MAMPHPTPAPTTLGQRLAHRMAERSMHAAELARRAKTTEATISNWLNDNVQLAHVKAMQLFNIANALEIDPQYLLTGEAPKAAKVHEPGAEYGSQELKRETLTLAIQLATEADDALRERGRTLPPSKRAELAMLAMELLQEGLPKAKVLRFVVSAAA